MTAIAIGSILGATYIVATFPPARLGPGSASGLPAALALTAVEGVLVGGAQASVLYRVTSRVNVWIVAVVAVALAQGSFMRILVIPTREPA